MNHSFRSLAFGSHIRTLRCERGLTHEQLASRCEMSADSLARLEQGGISPSLSTMRALARELDVSLSSMFGALEEAATDLTKQLLELTAGRSPKEIALVTELARMLLCELDARRT